MHQSYLARVEGFLKAEVQPIADNLDSDCRKLLEVFNRFKQLGILPMLIPRELGGLGGDRCLLAQYNMLLSNYSAALVFFYRFSIRTLFKYYPYTILQRKQRNY